MRKFGILWLLLGLVCIIFLDNELASIVCILLANIEFLEARLTGRLDKLEKKLGDKNEQATND